MPPQMKNLQKRMTANPARPVARYRPGKAVQEEESSDEDEEEEQVQKQPERRSAPRPQQPKPKAPVEPSDDEEGFVTDEEEADEGEAAVADSTRDAPSIHQTSRAPHSIPGPIAQTQAESSEEEDEEDSSVEEKSSSEDEAPQRKFQRPTFIKQSDRNKSEPSQNSNSISNAAAPTETGSLARAAANASTPDVDESLRRRTQADLYIKDHLEREILARAAGKKSWDDDDELDPEQMVDDTDGVDPESEYQAWKLRELRRLKRDREAIEAREKEIEEVERRRNLTQEERDREDREFIAKQREERDEGRSKSNYLARYHHKGAFFQDDETAEILKKRDIMGARFVDDVGDKSTLPEYMRVRDMTKLGKKGRTRYTDLRGEDTGRFGEDIKRWRGVGDDRGRGPKADAFAVGAVDERFSPDQDRHYGQDRNDDNRRRDQGSDNDYRRRRSRSRSPQRRRRNDSGNRGRTDETYRPESERRRRSRSSYSRSRSPPPPPRRKRSPSPYSERDKRRRLET